MKKDKTNIVKETKLVYKDGDVFKKMKQWDKEHPILSKLQIIYYTITGWINRNILNIPHNIKHFIQRGKRGWTDSDWWNFDYYISTVIIGCLTRLKKEGDGLPIGVDTKSEKQAIKKWHSILDTIINTFKTNIKIINDDLRYVSTTLKAKTKIRREQRALIKQFRNKHPDYPTRVMSEKECKEYEKGFDLFKEHFFSLWN